jgi:hypothetical protein
MAEGWSKQKVTAILAAYSQMLVLKIDRQGYNKTQRNRDLQGITTAHARSFIEFKHQYISAVPAHTLVAFKSRHIVYFRLT